MIKRSFKTQGVIIKRFNFGEADKIMTAFTKHRGKINFIAKGVRKIKSRKASSLELFCHSALFIIKGKNLDLVTEVKTLNFYPRLRKNLKKVAITYQLCELIERITAFNQENYSLYFLLIDSLQKIENSSKANTNILITFKKELLKHTGFGLPQDQSPESLDQYLEEILERKIKSKNILGMLDP